MVGPSVTGGASKARLGQTWLAVMSLKGGYHENDNV